jgi:hypothetical protein
MAPSFVLRITSKFDANHRQAQNIFPLPYLDAFAEEQGHVFSDSRPNDPGQ